MNVVFIDYWSWYRYIRQLFPLDNYGLAPEGICESWSQKEYWIRRGNELIAYWNGDRERGYVNV